MLSIAIVPLRLLKLYQLCQLRAIGYVFAGRMESHLWPHPPYHDGVSDDKHSNTVDDDALDSTTDDALAALDISDNYFRWRSHRSDVNGVSRAILSAWIGFVTNVWRWGMLQ